MKKCFTIMMAVIIASATITSCKKYEDGPSFSLRSKAGRIDNEWQIDMVKVNGQDVTTFMKASMPDFLMTIKKAGTYEILADGDREIGTWSFDDKKEKITLTENASKDVTVWTITRLSNDEFWFIYEDGSDKEEWHLKAK